MRPLLVAVVLPAAGAVLLAAGAVLLPAAVGDAWADTAAPPAVLDSLSAVLTDTQAQLASLPDAPYYVALALDDHEQVTIQGTHGAYAGLVRGHDRSGDVDLRIGSMQLDNTHKIRDAGWFDAPRRPQIQAPLAESGAVLRALFMRAVDDVYRDARQQLIKVKSNNQVKVGVTDTSADFSAAPVVVDSRPVPPLELDEAAWIALTREASAIYLDYPAVYDSAVQIVASRDQQWLATSEGTRIEQGNRHFRVATWGTSVADDGGEIQVYDYVDVATPEHLPAHDAVLAMVRGVAQRVTQLRAAPLIDPWSGPAILRGRAAGVFFHEIFGHRVEGHRQKDEDEGQTFTSRVGKPILPSFLSVVDDPTLARRGDFDLNGTYAYDDEGVPAERVQLVDAGVLKNFLLSRSPVAGFPRSNGHGRREAGLAAVARQGNLMVEATRTVTYAKLREMLVAEVKKQGEPFGLIFDDISGGFTFTGRSEPNSFVVSPVTVWRVWPDGRPDELVRGVDLIGTPLTTFARIVAAAYDVDVFNGVCGAESGWVPVSASSPSLLVSEVEVQRHEKGNDRPPILGAP
jgi:TldD protein